MRKNMSPYRSCRLLRRVTCGVMHAAVLAAANAGAVTCIGPSVPVPGICGLYLPAPTISCTVPSDAPGPVTTPLFLVQYATNIFSWQAFVGLQWPASKTERGQPDPNVALGAPGPTVWETWREANEVFRHDANQQPLPPLAWNDPSPIPAQCSGADRVLYRSSKVDDLLSDTNQPTGATATRPLTLKDQKRELTRYEIRMNYTAYQTITAPQNQWWNGARQATLNSVIFPSGSMIAKAAWIPVSDADAPRFRTTNACVCDSADPQGAGQCTVRKMGLAGFHLMSKTPSAPQWFWSTFEQIDNVPAGSCTLPANSASAAGISGTASLAPAPTYWNPNQGLALANQQTPGTTPNQICREIPIPNNGPVCSNPLDATDNVQAMNAAMQVALAPTSFARYALINTQWPAPPGASYGPAPGEPHTAFKVFPALLGNTTLESFIQDTSSCMGCHAMARTRRHASLDPADRGFVSADFTFMLGLATPALAPLPLLRGLTRNECGVSLDPKCAGWQIANNTYELLPQNVGAKLHCASCHLDAGRNPRASWWSGMVAKYSTPEYLKKGGIAGRINSCFTNSLNGSALCTPNAEGKCPDNPSMSGLIAYMSWLSVPQNNPEHIPKPANPFPVVSPGAGLKTRGGEIYQQKCAFCHGRNGEGRYEDHTYFRPALWGTHSFNTSAGMDTATDLAQFVYGNMPLGSGGELSQQEARDLSCYIDSQTRPKGPKPINPVSALSGVNCNPLVGRSRSSRAAR